MIVDQLFARSDMLGRMATLTAPAINSVIGARPGTVRRKLLAQLTGISAQRLMTPYERRRQSTPFRRSRRRVYVAADPRVTVFPTCLVAYRRPQIGRALVDVYTRNGIACEIARVGC